MTEQYNELSQKPRPHNFQWTVSTWFRLCSDSRPDSSSIEHYFYYIFLPPHVETEIDRDNYTGCATAIGAIWWLIWRAQMDDWWLKWLMNVKQGNSFWVLEWVLMQVHLTELPPTLPEHQFHQNEHIFASHQPTVSVEGITSLHIVPSISKSVDSPENEFRYSAIRATSHPFAHAKSAIRWLQWLLRNQSNCSQRSRPEAHSQCFGHWVWWLSWNAC